MEGKRILALLSFDSTVKERLLAQVGGVIGQEIEIKGYAIDKGIQGPLSADLVITTGPLLMPFAQKTFPGARVICGKWVITGENLEQVIMAPKGSRALVVNHPKRDSQDTIRSLQALGIDHIKYEGFWKQKKICPANFDLIISTGMMHIAPPCELPKVDIGPRTLSIDTFYEVLHYFSLNVKYLAVFENNYNRMLVKASWKIRELLEHSEQIRRHQDVVLRAVDEAILSLDAGGNIAVANASAEQMFGLKQPFTMNDALRGVLEQVESRIKASGETENQSESSAIIKYRGKELRCQRTLLLVQEQKRYIYTFRSVAHIQALEYDVRKRLSEKRLVARYTFDDLWGYDESPVKERTLRFAATDQNILITGESGTGKEIFAQAIHNASGRAKGPFVAINFAAISSSLMESEIFGYEEGAFTGAQKGGKEGFFELAHNGTIFLDEIGDVPLRLQPLLLRVLEEREVTRVGGRRNIPVNVRVLAATNKNLRNEVKSGRFREDLYFRLNVLTVQALPLRSVRDQIPVFINRFLQERFAVTLQFHPMVIQRLQQYDWPGNMREMKSVSEYMYYVSQGEPCVLPQHLPEYIMELVGQEAFAPEEDMAYLRNALQGAPALLEALLIYKNNEGKAIGRRMLADELQHSYPYFSESNARNSILRLQEMGLIQVGTTRQGSWISPKGLRVLEQITRSPLHDPYR